MGQIAGSTLTPQELGQQLRLIRQAKGYTQDQLAARSDLDPTRLREIEEARRVPTLGTLWKLTAGLGVPFAELLGSTRDGVSVQRRAQSPVLRSADGVLESRPLVSPGSDLWVEAYELTLAARGCHSSEPHPRGTRETLVVLEGGLAVQVAGGTHLLEPGDSISFPADTAHTYTNPMDVPGRYHDIIVYER
jgi:transcriptional regulator with XRE-family HTH domain